MKARLEEIAEILGKTYSTVANMDYNGYIVRHDDGTWEQVEVPTPKSSDLPKDIFRPLLSAGYKTYDQIYYMTEDDFRQMKHVRPKSAALMAKSLERYKQTIGADIDARAAAFGIGITNNLEGAFISLTPIGLRSSEVADYMDVLKHYADRIKPVETE